MARASPIRALDPNVSLTQALQRIFIQRLSEVRRHACQMGDTCPPALVHDLRVSVRRLYSLLRVFRSGIDSHGYERVRGQLKAVLDALGDLRERDVFLKMLRNSLTAKGHPKDPFITSLQAVHLKARRRLSGDIVKIIEEMEHNGLWTLAESTFRSVTRMKVRLKRTVSFRQSSKVVVSSLALRFLRRRKALLSHWCRKQELHRLRIAGKSLRYTMEVFRDYYGKEFRQCLRIVEKVVECLGRVHDCDVFIRLLRGYRDAHPELVRSSKNTADAMLSEAIEKRRQSRKSLSRLMKDVGGQRLYRQVIGAMDLNK